MAEEERASALARTAMLVTLDTSQLLRSSLKVAQAVLQPLPVAHEPEDAQKTYDISATCDTSHVLIWPYMAAALVELVHHACAAGSSAARFAKTCPPDDESRRASAPPSRGASGVASRTVSPCASPSLAKLALTGSSGLRWVGGAPPSPPRPPRSRAPSVAATSSRIFIAG